jgi:hypothetical protein
MALTLIIDVVVVAVLAFIALTKGVEAALPFFVFVVTLVPGESKIAIPGLFDLTTARLAIIVLLGFYFVPGKGAQPADGQKQKLPLRLILALMILWSLVSAANSIVFTASLKYVLSALLDYLLVFYLFVKLVNSTEMVHKILRGFIAGLLVCCVLGLPEMYTDWGVTSLFPAVTHTFTGIVDSPQGRLHSTFPHSILFGDALALGIPVALYLIALAKSAKQRIWLWIAVLLMFWNVYKTVERGPWLGVVISLALLLLFSKARIRKYILALCLLSYAVILIRPGVWKTIKDSYYETINPTSVRGGSYRYRYALMNAALERLEAAGTGRMLWGFGQGSFGDLQLRIWDDAMQEEVNVISCDSSFVSVMVQQGYVALLLVLALLLLPAATSLRAFTRLPKPSNLLSLIFLINIVTYAFLMGSVECWDWGQQAYMIWIVFALAMIYPRLAREEQSSPSAIGVAETAPWELVTASPSPRVPMR